MFTDDTKIEFYDSDHQPSSVGGEAPLPPLPRFANPSDECGSGGGCGGDGDGDGSGGEKKQKLVDESGNSSTNNGIGDAGTSVDVEVHGGSWSYSVALLISRIRAARLF